ncbi:putative chaperone protein EcpD [compost metagenome]
MLRVANPSAYHVTFTALDINDGQQKINADMVPPFGEASYPLTAVKMPEAIRVSFTTLNDYGGETPREQVRVPQGTTPVAVKAEPLPPPAASADGNKQ